jgi:GNAT superfamily N-acetyltransferase
MEAVVVRPVDRVDWSDVEAVLGGQGSVRGCWCMFFRQSPQERRTEWGEGNRAALKDLVVTGTRPGLLAYRGATPVGWVSVAPRDQYQRLDRSPITKRVDDEPVWSLVCLYVPREYRGAGVSRALVRGAVEHAWRQGAGAVEAYPVDDVDGSVPADAAYHGLVSVLAAVGFVEVARRQPRRPVMRLSAGNTTPDAEGADR